MIFSSRAFRVLAAATITGVVTVTAGATAASADTNLIGWTATADANAVDIVVDDAAGLSGVHPLAEIDLPEDSADFETGPFGHALASILWPGAVAGNFGSLSSELPIPEQLQPLFGQLNDPVKAETFYPSGPQTATFPSGSSNPGTFEMTSQSGANGVSSKAGITDLNEASLFSVQGVEGATTATVGSAAKSTASASVGSMSLFGGLVTIGASTSTATATSDGVSPSGSSTTHLGAVTIMGHTVSVGSDGLVVGPAAATGLDSLLTPTTAAVNQFISLVNLKIVPLPATKTSQAPAEQVTSGGLEVSFSLPSTLDLSLDCSALNSLPSQLQPLTILCTLPGLLEGASVTMTLDRVTAQAIATPPFSLAGFGGLPSGGGLPAAAPSSSPVPVSSGSAPVSVSSSLAPVSSSPVSPAPSAATAAPPTGASAPTDTPSGTAGGASPPATSPPTSFAGLVPVSLSTPVKTGILGSLLFLAALGAWGMTRLARFIDAPPPETCPLEEDE